MPGILPLAVFYLLVQVRQLRLAFVVAGVAPRVSAVVPLPLVPRVVRPGVLALRRVASAVRFVVVAVFLLRDHDRGRVVAAAVFGARARPRALFVLFARGGLAPAFLALGLGPA